ncbi:response regulator [soil metagenome]
MTNKLYILVVDDETDIKDLFLQRFRKDIRAGRVEFVFAFSGEEALDKLKREEARAVLILSDINMPGMTGLELLRRIKGDTPEAKVMMVTAYGDVATRDTAMAYGADDFLTKPLDFDALRARIGLDPPKSAEESQ